MVEQKKKSVFIHVFIQPVVTEFLVFAVDDWKIFKSAHD